MLFVVLLELGEQKQEVPGTLTIQPSLLGDFQASVRPCLGVRNADGA